ncbi:MAG: glycosyltransferase [Sedimentisphaerales bacterium]|nr:glycosyltransferase [Sedimentisphaerales bacterium]
MGQLNDIVIISSNDFGTLWYQRQALAVHFAKAGHRVFYFNRTPSKWPSPNKLINWSIKKIKTIRHANLPENLWIITPFWLTPTKGLRGVNRRLIQKTLTGLKIKDAIVITDTPSYNSLDLIEQIRPKKVVYINSHNYRISRGVITAMLDSEEIYIQQSDSLFAVSEYITERTVRLSGGRKVLRSMPGVNYELFAKAFRGDEAQRAEKIYFYGMIQDVVDIELFNKLSKQFKVVLIGRVRKNIKKLISKNIELRPPADQNTLAQQLKEADILGLFYKQGLHAKGTMPAKMFESLATGKPVLVSGIQKDPVYSPHVYHFDGTESAAVEIIKNLSQTETPEKIKNRQAAGAEADWQKRFETFCSTIFVEDKGLPKFSVLMSVYAGDRADYFKEAMDSIINQTAKPDEIVLVKDGPVGEELNGMIDNYQERPGGILKVISLEENKGLGTALAEGVKQCSFDIIARMDADDISSPDRFEKQLKFLKNNPDISVVSSYLAAFEQSPEKVLFTRRGPLLHKQIEKLLRFRFCMNHAATTYRKKAILSTGNYLPFAGLEDYHLWARMILNGTKMATIGQVLYYHRWEKNLLKRRSGIKRAVQQIKLQRELLKIGFVTKIQFLRNVIIRSVATILPTCLTRQLRLIFGI